MTERYPWQESLWLQLAGQSHSPQARLLQGPRGIGKRALALRLMALLLCQQPEHHEACGRCKSCLLLAAGTHPDQFVLEPAEPGKNILIDQVRELVSFAGQTPQLGARKVILLEPAEAMNPAAANALLKTLEEPAASSCFLLVSHQPGLLLPTVRSRCVPVPCPVPAWPASQAWLAGQLPDCPADERDSLLQLAAGSPLEAIRLYGQEVLAQRHQVVEDIKQLLKQQRSPSQLVEGWKALPLLQLFDWFFSWTLQLLACQLQARRGADRDMEPVLVWLAGRAARSQVLALQDWLLVQRRAVQLKASFNRELLLEALLIRWLGLLS